MTCCRSSSDQEDTIFRRGWQRPFAEDGRREGRGGLSLAVIFWWFFFFFLMEVTVFEPRSIFAQCVCVWVGVCVCVCVWCECVCVHARAQVCMRVLCVHVFLRLCVLLDQGLRKVINY